MEDAIAGPGSCLLSVSVIVERPVAKAGGLEPKRFISAGGFFRVMPTDDFALANIEPQPGIRDVRKLPREFGVHAKGQCNDNLLARAALDLAALASGTDQLFPMLLVLHAILRCWKGLGKSPHASWPA